MYPLSLVRGWYKLLSQEVDSGKIIRKIKSPDLRLVKAYTLVREQVQEQRTLSTNEGVMVGVERFSMNAACFAVM